MCMFQDDCFTCFWCFILAPIGFAKGLLFGLPASILLTTLSTLISLLFLPKNFIQVVRVLFTSVRVGPNLRCLLFCMLPILLICLPIITVSLLLICSLISNTCILAVTLFEDTTEIETTSRCSNFIEKCWLSSGIIGIYQSNWDVVKEVWKFNRRFGSMIIESELGIPISWDGQIIEIPIPKLIFGILILVHGIIVSSIVCALLLPLKAIPLICRANYEYLQATFGAEFYLWLCIITGWMLLNTVVVPVCLIVGPILGCLGTGIASCKHALDVDSISEGFLEAWRIIRVCDQMTTEFIVCSTSSDSSAICSIIPRIRAKKVVVRRGHGRLALGDHNDGQVVRESSPLDLIFETLTLKCIAVTLRTVESKMITQEEVCDLDPNVLIGVPAIVLLDVIDQAFDGTTFECEEGGEAGKGGGSSTPSTTSTRSMTLASLTATYGHNGGGFIDGHNDLNIITKFWPKFKAIKTALPVLTPDDLSYCHQKLLGLPDSDNNSSILPESRKTMLNRTVISGVSSLSIDIGRLRRMQSAYPKIFERWTTAAAATNNGGDEVGLVREPSNRVEGDVVLDNVGGVDGNGGGPSDGATSSYGVTEDVEGRV